MTPEEHAALLRVAAVLGVEERSSVGEERGEELTADSSAGSIDVGEMAIGH